MIWGATAVLAEAYDGLNQLPMATMVTRRPLPPSFWSASSRCSSEASGFTQRRSSWKPGSVVRDEAGHDFTQFWVRRHDEYGR